MDHEALVLRLLRNGDRNGASIFLYNLKTVASNLLLPQHICQKIRSWFRISKDAGYFSEFEASNKYDTRWEREWKEVRKIVMRNRFESIYEASVNKYDFVMDSCLGVMHFGQKIGLCRKNVTPYFHQTFLIERQSLSLRLRPFPQIVWALVWLEFGYKTESWRRLKGSKKIIRS